MLGEECDEEIKEACWAAGGKDDLLAIVRSKSVVTVADSPIIKLHYCVQLASKRATKHNEMALLLGNESKGEALEKMIAKVRIS